MGEERQSQLQVPRTSNNHLKQQQQSVERVAKQKTANNKAKKKKIIQNRTRKDNARGKLRKHQVHYSGDFAKSRAQKKCYKMEYRKKTMQMQIIPPMKSKPNSDLLIIIIENVQNKCGANEMPFSHSVQGIPLRIRNVCRCYRCEASFWWLRLFG